MGHHFILWLTDHAKTSGHFVSELDYPSAATRRHIVAAYMEETSRLVDFALDPDVDSVEHVLMESTFFALKAAHFWIAHGIFPRPDNTMIGSLAATVGFIGVAKRMVKNYYEVKEEFIRKYEV